MELIKVKGVLQILGYSVQPGEETSAAHPALMAAKQLAREAGGDAPAPASPVPTYLDDIMQYSGNELLAEILANQERIKNDISQWQKDKERIAERRNNWSELQELLPMCRDMVFYADISTEQQAILTNRSLLAEPNPITPLISRAITELRQAIVHHQTQYQEEYDKCSLELEADEQWQKIQSGEQKDILIAENIATMPPLKLGKNTEVLDSLSNCSLSQWQDRMASLVSKFERARAEAVRRLQPKVQVVYAKRKVINTEVELHPWIAETEKRNREKLAEDPVSVN